MKKEQSYHIVAIALLIMALLAETFPKSLVVMDYYLNTETFAAYCINKDKPEMHCNGKCQMEKMMGKLAHHKKSQTRTETISSVYLIPQVIDFRPDSFILPQKNFFYYPNFTLSTFSSDFFHPPKLHLS